MSAQDVERVRRWRAAHPGAHAAHSRAARQRERISFTLRCRRCGALFAAPSRRRRYCGADCRAWSRSWAARGPIWRQRHAEAHRVDHAQVMRTQRAAHQRPRQPQTPAPDHPWRAPFSTKGAGLRQTRQNQNSGPITPADYSDITDARTASLRAAQGAYAAFP